MADEGDDERGFFAERPLVRPRKPDQAKEKPHYLGHRDRLRERFTHSASDDNLADYELLELILFRLIPRSDTKPVAKALLARFGTLGLGDPLDVLTAATGAEVRPGHRGAGVALQRVGKIGGLGQGGARLALGPGDLPGVWSFCANLR